MKIPKKIVSEKEIPKTSEKKQNTTDGIVLSIKKEDQIIRKSKTKKFASGLDIYNYINNWVIEQGTIGLEDKLVFFQLLGATVHAGISVPEALKMIGEQTKNPKLRKVINNLKLLIEDGESLAGAMKRNDDVFDKATCAIVNAGETSGKLNSVLAELVKQLEQMNKLQKRVKAVMTYPVFVFAIMVLLTAVVLIFIVPKLVVIFGTMQNLPLPTRILQGLSDLVIGQGFLLLFLFGIVTTIFIYWKRTKVGARQWAGIVISTPIISKIIKGMILSRFTRIFGFLISSGVPIVDGLKITAMTTNNVLYEEKLLLAADDLTKGISIAENISDNNKMFPKMLVNMISIGEKSASLEGIMMKISDYYEDEINRKIDGLSKIMEPIILVVIALFAVFFIIAVYLPILRINDQILVNVG